MSKLRTLSTKVSIVQIEYKFHVHFTIQLFRKCFFLPIKIMLDIHIVIIYKEKKTLDLCNYTSFFCNSGSDCIIFKQAIPIK